MGQSYEEVAAAVGVSVRTIRRWMLEPAFADALRVTDHDFLRQLARSLNQASTQALQTLIDVTTNENASDGVRVRAASEILKHRAVFFDLMTLADRVEALESAVYEGIP